MIGNADPASGVDSKLIAYLEAHQGTATYLVATPSSNAADTIILATGKAVMALGGFTGSDPILTTTQLASLVKSGTVRFFLLKSFNGGGQIPPQILDRIPQQFRNRPQGGFRGFGGQQSALTTYVTKNCTIVPTKEWQASSSSAPSIGSFFGRGGANQLYDCATTH